MINIQMQPEYIRATVITLAVFLLIVVCAFGFVAGRGLARGDLARNQAEELVEGLGYFFADQDRFPSTQEFEDPAIFGVYASGIPVRVVASAACPEVIDYESLTLRTFSITYCIPRAVGGVPAGIYEITNRDVGI